PAIKWRLATGGSVNRFRVYGSGSGRPVARCRSEKRGGLGKASPHSVTFKNRSPYLSLRFSWNMGRKEKPSESRMPNGSFTIHKYEYRNGMNCFCAPEMEDCLGKSFLSLTFSEHTLGCH